MSDQTGAVRLESAVVEDGFARCVNTGCVMHDEDQPIKLQVETVNRYGTPPLTNLIVASNVYKNPVDDGVVPCPECGRPRAIVDGPRVVYPHMATAG
jgi:hypothetical protein